jgi:hypothetical protein
MKIDERQKGQAVRRFSAQMQDVPEHILTELEAMFNNDQPDDFYAGLLSGLVAAEVLRKHDRGQYVPLLIAFLCHKLEQREIL